MKHLIPFHLHFGYLSKTTKVEETCRPLIVLCFIRDAQNYK